MGPRPLYAHPSSHLLAFCSKEPPSLRSISWQTGDKASGDDEILEISIVGDKWTSLGEEVDRWH